MTLAELVPHLHELERADKLRAVQILVADLAQEEGVTPFVSGATYPIWSPYDSFDAAAKLSKMLAEAREEDYE